MVVIYNSSANMLQIYRYMPHALLIENIYDIDIDC